MARVKIWPVLAVAVLLAGAFATLATVSRAQDEAPPPPAPSVAEVALPGGALPGNPAIQLELVAGGLIDPVNIANAGDGSNRLFVVERTGTVRVIQDGQVLPDPFLDITPQMKIDFLEQGLLGLAFHPDYAANGRFFVYYSDYQTNGSMMLAEYAVSADDPNVADPDSGRILFSIPDPYINHNGGTIKFGPDGYLYVAIGDGGYAGDPYDNAQDLSNLLGKILRIDVDNGDPYGIPADNPFAEAGEEMLRSSIEEPGRFHPDGSPEIWAYGLRNPWQFSFDRETGELYIADVGQNYWEEINVAPAGEGGQNYGWDILEGTHCYPADVTECHPFGVMPVAEYDHGDGSCSITGIGVHRAEASPALNGIYFTSDFCSGKVWGLARDDAGAWVFQELLDTDLLAAGAGEGEDGQLYLTSCACAFGRTYDPFENPQGTVWRIVAADQVSPDATLAPTSVPEGAAIPDAATPTTDEGTAGDATPEAAGGEGQTDVTVASYEIYFEPTQVFIAADTDVVFTLPNNGVGPHSFVIDALGINVQLAAAGETQTVTINAPAGEYEFYCDVPGHLAAGMVGTLVVQ